MVFRLQRGHGELPFIVFWQSLNGHPHFMSFEEIGDARERVKHLDNLGRAPQLYLRLDHLVDVEN